MLKDLFLAICSSCQQILLDLGFAKATYFSCILPEQLIMGARLMCWASEGFWRCLL